MVPINSSENGVSNWTLRLRMKKIEQQEEILVDRAKHLTKDECVNHL